MKPNEKIREPGDRGKRYGRNSPGSKDIVRKFLVNPELSFISYMKANMNEIQRWRKQR